MQLPTWPPADLLEQVEGVQQGLRRRRRLGMAGWIGLLLSTAQIVVIVLSSEWWQGVRDFQWDALWTQWPFLAAAGIFVLSLLLISWSRFWLQESRQPFRYTLSVDGFPAVENSAAVEEKMAWLQPDLERRLNERIKRLSLLDEEIVREESGGGEGAEPHKHESHIHVSGRYVVRRNPKGRWNIEVMPRVRIGPYGQAETLAHPERFYLDYETERPAGDKDEKNADRPPTLTVRQYERIVERVYSSVSTEIYKQIRQDVQRKIDLLPARRFRAAAYFHEAEDYARSNTLDAYEEARKLYYEAMRLYDPISYGQMVHSRSRAVARRAANSLRRFQRWLRERLVPLWPRLAQNEVMAGRAEVGYANMLIYHRVLASLSGHEPNSFFEARSVAYGAVRRLERVPEDVAAKKQYLFDAYVTLSLALYYMGSNRAAEPYLRQAQQVDPARAERDAQYLLASGHLESRPHSRIPYYRRAVERDPKFEIARFVLGLTMETIWRSQPNLERSGARLIVDEYERVLLLNPGNIGAWANIGYILWLLNEDVPGGLSAGDAFEYGRDYKEIKPETVVAELDYGIARLKAEQGELEAAYEYYTNAVSALLARGISPDEYYFGSMSDSVLQRFIDYRDSVLEQTDGDAPFARRVRGFMWNDYGEACYNYYWRSRFQGWLDNAAEAFEKAIALDPDFVLPRYNLARVHQARWAQAQAKDSLREVLRREPRWISAVLDMADITVQTASNLRKQIKEEGKKQEKLRQQLREKREELRVRKRPGGEASWRRPEEVHFRRREDTGGGGLTLSEGDGESLAGERLLQYLKRIAPVAEREATPPSPYPPTLRPAVRTEDDALQAMQQEIKELETEIEQLSQDIQRDRQRIEKAEEEATQLVRRFLPHRPFRNLGFSAERINRLLDADINWEKDLNESHGLALLRYAQMLVTLNGENSDPEVIEAVYNLNLHIYEKFYPDAFNLLNNLNNMAPWLEKLADRRLTPAFLQRRQQRYTLARDLVRQPGETSAEWSQRVRRIVRQRARRLLQDNYEADPAHCNILSWLTAEAFGQSPFMEQIKQESVSGDRLGIRLQWLNHKQELFEEATSTKNAASFGLLWLINELARLQEEFQAMVEEAKGSDQTISRDAGNRAEACRQSALDACQRAAATCEDAHALLEVGRHYSRFGRRDEGIELLQRLLEDEGAADDDLRTDALQEVVLLLWDAGRHDEACQLLNETGHQLASAADGWHINFVRRLQHRVDDASRFNELESWLHEEYRRHCRQDHAATAANTAKESHAALMYLVRERYQPALAAPVTAAYRRRKNLSAQLPLTTPVVLEAGADLFPEEEGWSDDHPLFTEYIPQMRQRIRERMGVQVPGVRVRANEGAWLKDKYLVQIEEIPIVSGGLDPGRHFYPEATAVASHATLVLNPRTGRETGAWLTPYEPPATALDGPGWNYFEYMIYHLETVLKENLPTFLGVQELSNLLDQWADGDNADDAQTRQQLRARALPDGAARQRLLDVCHHLLREGVPIADLHTILTVFAQAEGDSSPLFTGEQCRRALRPHLPGNEGHRRLIGWSEPFEEEILRNIDDEFLALLPETTQELLAAVRERVGNGAHQDLALVVRNGGARPYVRRLTALEFPQVAVLAEDEISGSYVRFLEPVAYTLAERG